LLGRLTGREPIDDLPPPRGLAATLRPYQGRGYSWLSFLRRWELGACLADDMGLGKTIQTIQTRRDEDAITRLKSLTGPFVLRRLKTDKSIIDGLPEKLEMKVFCTLTKEQASMPASGRCSTCRSIRDCPSQGPGIETASLRREDRDETADRSTVAEGRQGGIQRHLERRPPDIRRDAGNIGRHLQIGGSAAVPVKNSAT
jgi:hypothetical protein